MGGSWIWPGRIARIYHSAAALPKRDAGAAMISTGESPRNRDARSCYCRDKSASRFRAGRGRDRRKRPGGQEFLTIDNVCRAKKVWPDGRRPHGALLQQARCLGLSVEQGRSNHRRPRRCVRVRRPIGNRRSRGRNAGGKSAMA